MSLQLGYWIFVSCSIISFSSCKLYIFFPVLIPESDVRMLSSPLTLLTSLSLKGEENKKKVAYFRLFVAQHLVLIFSLEHLHVVLLGNQFWGFIKLQLLLCSKLTDVTPVGGNFLPPEHTSFTPFILNEGGPNCTKVTLPLPPNHSDLF